jgi:uncharacterized membrane protein
VAWEYNCHKKDTALYKVTWVYSLLDLSSLEEFPVNLKSFPLTSSPIIYCTIGCIWLVIKCIIGFFRIMLQLDLINHHHHHHHHHQYRRSLFMPATSSPFLRILSTLVRYTYTLFFFKLQPPLKAHLQLCPVNGASQSLANMCNMLFSHAFLHLMPF